MSLSSGNIQLKIHARTPDREAAVETTQKREQDVDVAFLQGVMSAESIGAYKALKTDMRALQAAARKELGKYSRSASLKKKQEKYVADLDVLDATVERDFMFSMGATNSGALTYTRDQQVVHFRAADQPIPEDMLGEIAAEKREKKERDKILMERLVREAEEEERLYVAKKKADAERGAVEDRKWEARMDEEEALLADNIAELHEELNRPGITDKYRDSLERELEWYGGGAIRAPRAAATREKSTKEKRGDSDLEEMLAAGTAQAKRLKESQAKKTQIKWDRLMAAERAASAKAPPRVPATKPPRSKTNVSGRPRANGRFVATGGPRKPRAPNPFRAAVRPTAAGQRRTGGNHVTYVSVLSKTGELIWRPAVRQARIDHIDSLRRSGVVKPGMHQKTIARKIFLASGTSESRQRDLKYTRKRMVKKAEYYNPKTTDMRGVDDEAAAMYYNKEATALRPRYARARK